MKKKIISALMAMAMCVSALPMAVFAENDTTTELPEFTRKFRDECLLNPEESEENRLIHNLFKGNCDRRNENSKYYDEFLGLYGKSEPYHLQYPKNNATVPGHDDIKCVQEIQWDNWTSIAFYIDNPYITKNEFEALSDNKKLITTAKIFDETGEFIASMVSTCLYRFPYYVGENGKGYSYKGDELDIFNGEVMSAYCNPEELNIYDGKSVYKYSDVYDGDPDTALRADFYQYLEDNNVEQVFERLYDLENYRVYLNKERGIINPTIDLSDELFITDKDGNVIPNDPNLLQVNCISNVPVFVYEVDGKYIFEDETKNRIVFSSFDDSDDRILAQDFFINHSISESYMTPNVIETYLSEEDELKFYNEYVPNIFSAEYLKGDANIDGDVDIADAVFIMQSLSNPDEYKLSEQGRLNADYNGDGGVTALDALEIQMMTIS